MKIRKKIGILLIIFVCITVIMVAMQYAHHFTIYNLEKIFEGFGCFSYILFFLLCVFRSFLLLPCGFTSALGGLLFGSVLGSIISLIGYTVGSTLLFYLSRILGKTWARRFLKKQAAALEQVVTRNGFFSILVLRVVPILPFDAVSCIGGISDIKIFSYVSATLIGSLPGVFLYVYFGEALKSLRFSQIILPLGIILVLSFASVGYTILGRLRLNQKNS